MKTLNEEQILGLKHGIEEGFTIHGFSLSERDQLIISVTIKTVVEAFERINS